MSLGAELIVFTPEFSGKYFSGGLEDYRQSAVAAYRRKESLRRRDGRHFMELRKDRT